MTHEAIHHQVIHNNRCALQTRKGASIDENLLRQMEYKRLCHSRLWRRFCAYLDLMVMVEWAEQRECVWHLPATFKIARSTRRDKVSWITGGFGMTSVCLQHHNIDSVLLQYYFSTTSVPCNFWLSYMVTSSALIQDWFSTPIFSKVKEIFLQFWFRTNSAPPGNSVLIQHRFSTHP